MYTYVSMHIYIYISVCMYVCAQSFQPLSFVLRTGLDLVCVLSLVCNSAIEYPSPKQS